MELQQLKKELLTKSSDHRDLSFDFNILAKHVLKVKDDELNPFTIINEATVSKDELKSVINSFSYLHDQNFRTLQKYYDKASNNREVFHKLNILSQLIDKFGVFATLGAGAGIVALIKNFGSSHEFALYGCESIVA